MRALRVSIRVIQTQVLEVVEIIKVTSVARGRERNVCTSHRSMRMALNDLDRRGMVRFGVLMRSNMKHHYFFILSSYCYDIR